MKRVLVISLLFIASTLLALPDLAEARRGRSGPAFRGARLGPVLLHRGGYWGPYAYGAGYGRSHGREGGGQGSLGKMDFEVQPKTAQVFVNGHFVGEARKLDGYPSYLWLEQGTYEVTIYAPGYQTLTQQLAIFPKRTTEITVRMAPGEAVMPSAPASAPAPVEHHPTQPPASQEMAALNR